MAYTPGFDYDIFISFSHQDNAPRPGQGTTGWIAQFARDLEWWLNRRGLKGLEVWLDEKRLSGAAEFDDRIEQALRRTALLIVVHSHNYRKSEYCEQELGCFIQAAESQPCGLAIEGERRIFNVLIDNIPRQDWTDHWTRPLAGTSGFPFHDAGDDPKAFGDPIEDSNRKDYDAAMKPVVDAAARLLQAFPPPKDNPKTPPTDRFDSDHRPQVLIADAPDSQAKLRTRLIANIGDRARIAEPIPPPYLAADHDAALKQALERADLSIHLLGAWPGRMMDGGEYSYPRRQAELAKDAPARSLFWLPEALDLADLEDDPDHSEWLQAIETDARSGGGYQLQRSSREQLIQDALEQIAQLRSDQPAAGPGRTIVIDPHPADQHHGFALAADLKRRAPELNLDITRDSTEPAERWTDFEQLVTRAQDLIVLFGQVAPEWVRGRIERAVKIAAAQLGETVSLETIWVLLLPRCPGRQALPSLPRFLQVQVLDNTGADGIAEATIEQVLGSRSGAGEGAP